MENAPPENWNLVNSSNGVQIVLAGAVPSQISAPSATSNENTQSTVSWTVPNDNEQSITSYTITATYDGDIHGVSVFVPSGSPSAGSTLSAVVSGLVNARSYTFTVIASNAIGNSTPSNSSASARPAGVPATPTAPTAVAGDGQATVNWTAPYNNGAAITEYTIVTSPVRIGGNYSWTSGPLSAVITGLTNGTSYTFTVQARNSNGAGSTSSSSASVTPVAAEAPPPTVPTAPSVLSLLVQNGAIKVGWASPLSNGGSRITSYTITATSTLDNSTTTETTVEDGRRTVFDGIVSGLTNGTPYNFTVFATNAVGNGPLSDPFGPETPALTNVPCFPKGVRVATGLGPVAVEDLKTGDLVLTAEGRQVPVKIYSTTLTTTTTTAPYKVLKGYRGLKADLYLSPLHAFQIKKGLWQIPKYAALSDTSIQQYDIGKPVTYYHLECPNFFTDNLIVDGCVVESFAANQAKGLKTLYKYNATLKGFTRASQMAVLKK